jgi:large subunit ribosomal protein L15
MPKAKKQAAEAEPALTLNDLRPAKGSTRAKLRVGRGRASGAGKTCNRGHNGEGQRSGRSSKRGFEGGQMPGYRQMPKINGFRIINRRVWLELNIGDLEKILPGDVDTLSVDTMREWGILKPKHDGVRLLGNGEISRKISVEANYATPGAKEKLEAAGGKLELVS